MKAKKHQPLDFSALDTEKPEASTEQREVAPEAAPDLDLAIDESPMLGLPPSTLADANPLTGVRADAGRGGRTSRKSKAAAAASGGAVYTAAAVVSVLWALAPIAYAIGYRQSVAPLQNDPFAMAVFALLAIGPAAFVWVAAYMIRQGMNLAAETQRTRELAEQMLTPAAMAAAGAGDAVTAVRAQIENAAQMAADARDRMLTLRETLAVEARGLTEATADSARTAVELAASVGQEREALKALSDALDAQSTAITEAIGRQARMVAEASDLAETQLREAEAALTARAADLTSAAGAAADAARTGAEDVARQAAKLEAAGEVVAAQLQTVDDGLNQQRQGIAALAETLRVEQEDFAVQAETRAAQMADFANQARSSVSDISETAAVGAETLRGLIVAASEQLGEIARAGQAEREGLAEEVIRSLDAIKNAAQSDRDDLGEELHQVVESLTAAAEKARSAAQGHVEIAKSHVDQLNEAAFAAGQRADAVFDARLSEARELIEQSAMMAEQAGARSAQHLDQGVAAARAAVNEVERLLTGVSERVGGLQGEAQAQVQAVRDAVEQGLDEMLASARRAAEETQAIDAAFQERVKRNYDMLSEAVSLMSAVGATPSVGPSVLRAATPLAPLTPPASPAAAAAASPPPTARAEPAKDASRRRLRLTPTATDEEFRTVFDKAEPKPAPAPADPAADDDSAWTWKDLLGGLSRAPAAETPAVAEPAQAPSADAHAAEYLIGQISFMGIDPAALLPRSRIEEIAVAVQAGDKEGAREVVKRLAPAAIRRLVRKLFSDNQLRSETERFLVRYGSLVDEAAQQDRQGFLIATLLGSDSGRTYLLLDAAVGDLA
jgi:hypothetical protein